MPDVAPLAAHETTDAMRAQIAILEEELRARMGELEALTVQARHLRADLDVKDGYVAFLEEHTDSHLEQLRLAERDAAPVRLLRRAIRRLPHVMRTLHPLTRRLGDRFAPSTAAPEPTAQAAADDCPQAPNRR